MMPWAERPALRSLPPAAVFVLLLAGSVALPPAQSAGTCVEDLCASTNWIAGNGRCEGDAGLHGHLDGLFLNLSSAGFIHAYSGCVTYEQDGYSAEGRGIFVVAWINTPDGGVLFGQVGWYSESGMMPWGEFDECRVVAETNFLGPRFNGACPLDTEPPILPALP